jgi:hypothetical protein
VLELAVEAVGQEWLVSDLGTTDAFLAERGTDWAAPPVQRATDSVCGAWGVQVHGGTLRKRCAPTSLVHAIMAVLQAAQAIAGAAYAAAPRMPRPHGASARRVKARLHRVLREHNLAEQMETVVLRGKSQHEVEVVRVRHRPIVVLPQSLRQDPIRQASAAAFEWLDLKQNGMPEGSHGVCVYDPPATADPRLADAQQILRTYFDIGAFSIDESQGIVAALRALIPPHSLVA